jgi:hypothetical protein
MAESSGRAREISLGEDFGDVAVTVNGARIDVGADGHVIVSTPGGDDGARDQFFPFGHPIDNYYQDRRAAHAARVAIRCRR